MMLIAKTIRERLQRDPFEPFVIRASSGEAVRVASPDLAVLMKTEIFVAAPNSDRWTQLPYLHIAAVESDTNGNGRRSRRRGAGERRATPPSASHVTNGEPAAARTSRP
jgi:hypothetical protein